MCRNLMCAFVAAFSLLICAQAIATCELVNRSENVVLMKCSQVLDSGVMVTAAKRECGDDATCNVWFWSSEITLPVVAPKVDAELPASLTSKALAVWANDSGSLMTLKKKAD